MLTLDANAHFRRNMEDKTQHRLATEMDIALMKAHLRLDVSQMMDKQIRDSFMRVSSRTNQLIVGTTYSFSQTNRPPHTSTCLLPNSYIHYRRIIDFGIDDSSTCLDNDPHVYNQPTSTEHSRKIRLPWYYHLSIHF